MTDRERLTRALGWLDTIADQVKGLLINDYVFWEIQKIIKANSELCETRSTFFFEWIRSVFAHSVAAGIRRQTGLDRQSVSLHRLLLELQKYPRLITRKYHRNLYRQMSAEVLRRVDAAYDEYVGPGRTELDPARIQDDIDLLKLTSQRIHHYVDRIVAHHDQRGLNRPVPTFHDLRKCLLEVEELVLKYLELIKGEVKMNLLPAFSDDWKSVFRIAWIQ